jgi:pimeloyl-ACP methyl ester carboxylesterase
VRFAAADGTALYGWLTPSSSAAPAIVLIPGFKADRTTMEPYARFLHSAGFNVLLYDSRGTGQSAGQFSLGLREVSDVEGAISYLRSRRDLPVHRYGLLGVSMGAGVVIVAASRLPSVRATVADSAFVDQSATVDGLDNVPLGSVAFPLAPLGPWTVDHLLGIRLSTFSPLHAIARISPRAIFLIHSRYDGNPTTPLSGAVELYHAARAPKQLWIAPRGGHAEALAAQPSQYKQRVVDFFRRYLK